MLFHLIQLKIMLVTWLVEEWAYNLETCDYMHVPNPMCISFEGNIIDDQQMTFLT